MHVSLLVRLTVYTPRALLNTLHLLVVLELLFDRLARKRHRSMESRKGPVFIDLPIFRDRHLGEIPGSYNPRIHILLELLRL